MALILDEAALDILDELLSPVSDEQASAGTLQVTSAALSRAGIPDPVPQQADPVSGNNVINSGRTCFRLKNTDTAQHSVTFNTFLIIESRYAVSDDVVLIPAGATVWTGRFDTPVFGAVMTFLADSVFVQVSVFEP